MSRAASGNCLKPTKVIKGKVEGTTVTSNEFTGTMPCSKQNELPKQSNADRIRNMTDEELAEFIERIKNTCIVDAFGGEKMCETKAEVECKACKMKMGSILNWLKSEVKGSE